MHTAPAAPFLRKTTGADMVHQPVYGQRFIVDFPVGNNIDLESIVEIKNEVARPEVAISKLVSLC